MTATHALLGNAAVAAVLALLVLGTSYLCRSPAVRHAAWVLVLLKLVTPPLFSVSLPVLPAEAGSPGWWDRWRAEAASVAVVVWVVGAAAWFVWQGRRIVRFRRRVAHAEGAGPEVALAVRRLAKALGIARPPPVKAATGIGSPMLWGLGRGAVILFPRELLARLAPEARDTLLAHELAHFLRRDHWVRALEVVATGIYWWHPAVWLARVEIEAAEEECCDAWVVGGLAASPRRYAEALLATVDFAEELRRPCLPPGACAANRGARLLYRRLVGIARAQRPRRRRGAAALRAVALAALLIQPLVCAATPEAAVSPPTPVIGEAPLLPSSPPVARATGSNPPPKAADPRAWASAPAPDGTITALARDREVVLRRPDGTERVLGPGRPLALAFAPDSQRLATAGPGTLVRMWDYEGNCLAEAHVPKAARALAYTPERSKLLVLDGKGGISVFDPHTLARLSGWSVEGPANSIVCASDGETVAVAFGSWLDAETGWVECWSIAERRKLAIYSASAPVGAARFGPDGKRLVLGGWSGLLTWRTLPGGELIAERQMPKRLVAAASFSPDAGTLPLDPPPEPEPPELPYSPLLPGGEGSGLSGLPSSPLSRFQGEKLSRKPLSRLSKR
jgi:beta-lactamase regulating signal transducer with metallopeptidase domain